MTDFAITPIGNGDHDLDLATRSDGQLDFVIIGGDEDTWPREVAQRILYALGTWSGESAWDRFAGFPWLEGVFSRAPLDGIAALVYERIVEVDGVDGLIDQPILTLDTITRTLFIRAQVQCGTFVVPIETTIQGPTA